MGFFWLWLFVALGIYAYRLYRRITRGPQAEPETTDATTPARTDVPIIGAAPVLGTRLPSSMMPESVTPDSEVPIPPPVPEVTPAPSKESTLGSPSRSGLFAPTTTPAAAPTPVPAPTNTDARPTVAEVLRGIAMPCDLSPVIDPDRVFDPYRVAFSTNTATAAAVGAGVGDELERLEFTLASTSAIQLAATKQGQRVVVTIHADPEAVTYGDGQAFRNMPPGSVVVEFQT